MDFNHHSPTSSTTTTATTTNQNDRNHNNDPVHSWWEQISKARSRIHQLTELLPNDDEDEEGEDEDDQISSLADTDRPATSLLHSSAAYRRVSTALRRPHSGNSQDPLCQWLYDTYQSQQNELQHVVLSYLPLISSLYLHRIHYPQSDLSPSLAGFEAVLLAIYSSETKARNGKPVTVTIPDLSQPSLYHNPSTKPARSTGPGSNSINPNSKKNLIGVVTNVLEPQVAVKSTKRACIVGTCLDCYYKQISHMPVWSKNDFCKFAADWAGKDCECMSEFDRNDDGFGENNGVVEIIENVDTENENGSDIGENGYDDDKRIPLPWELLQPVLRILGHCLLGPMNPDEVRDVASVAVRRLYARASHDLVPQAILATRSLIRLDKGSRDEAKAKDNVSVSGGSNVNTPSKAKKPEILLVSK